MTDSDNLINTYLKEINSIPLLSHDEETELAIKAAQGDTKARDAIVRANLRFVVNVAKQYQNRGIELEDLISEGNVGLLTAIDHFDVTKGYHFISYAVWWIRQSILKAICEKSRAIRLPLNRANELVQIEKARKTVGPNKTETEEIEEIGRILGMESAHVREMIAISRETVSLDAPLSAADASGATIGSVLEDSRYSLPAEEAEKEALEEDINSVLNTLKPNEAKVIRLRYGLDGGRPMSLKEVGLACNLTKERIRQIEKRALVRIQHPARLSKLSPYYTAA